MEEKKGNKWDASLMPELLPIYYKKLFPFALYYKWLRYKESGPNYFRNREFSFTLKDDIYLRYRSYADEVEMEKDIKAKCPYKIDIGAVYTCSVSIYIVTPFYAMVLACMNTQTKKETVEMLLSSASDCQVSVQSINEDGLQLQWKRILAYLCQQRIII